MHPASHSQIVEDEIQKLRTEVNRLCQENVSLRDELAKIEQKFQSSKQLVVLLEEERKHLECMPSPSKYDQYIMDESQSGSKQDTPDSDDRIIDIYPFVSNDPEERTFPSTKNLAKSIISPGTSSKQVDYKPNQTLVALDELASCYVSMSQYELAVQMCKDALQHIEKVRGHDHPDVATILSTLGDVYEKQNKHNEATNSYNDALAIREKTLGKDHILVAQTLDDLASQYKNCQRYSDAELLYKRALEIKTNVLGEQDIDILITLNNLGDLYNMQEKYEEEERYIQQILEIYVSKYGPDDTHVAETKHHLATCYQLQDKYKEAEILYKEVISRGLEKEFGTIDDENNAICQMADEREDNKHINKDTEPMEEGEMDE